MLERLIIERFKSLERVELRLGKLNLFIGTNASGKSNLLDALRVLQGVGYGFTISEIFDGKPKGASSVVWDGIRGGSKDAVMRLPKPKMGPNPHKGTCRFAAQFRSGDDLYDYEIVLHPVSGAVRHESLAVNDKKIFATVETSERTPTIRAQVSTDKVGQPPKRDFEKNRSILHQLLRENNLPGERQLWIQKCVEALSNQQRLDLIPAQLRQYAQAQKVARLGERGEDFAALVKSFDKKTRAEYVSWLQELTPAEVDEVEIKKGAVGESLFALREGKNIFPAPVLSDGTLRFAALTAALFQLDMPDLLLLEEVENGIHPTRLRLLVELLRSRTKAQSPQILATTHSPILLAWLKPEDYPHTFYCVRDENGLSVIRPVADIPQFNEIVRRTPFSDLFAEGWLESTL